MQFGDYKRIFSNIMDDDMHLYSNQYDIWQLLLDMKETLSFNDKDVRDYAMTISKYTHELATYKAAETGSGDFDDLYWKLLGIKPKPPVPAEPNEVRRAWNSLSPSYAA